MQDNHSLGLGAGTPHWVAFTANSDTPYAIGALDLRDSPMVVEIPPGPFVSVVDDHDQRWVVDMGLPGPDKGQGGKYLIVPPGYQSKPPAGYRVVPSSTYKNLIVVRSIPQNGDIKTAMEKTKTVKVYPLANPSKLVTYVDVTGKNISSTSVPWEDNIQYWQRLRDVLARHSPRSCELSRDRQVLERKLF